jgi:hypothetical protein
VDGTSIWAGDGIHLTSNATRVAARRLMEMVEGGAGAEELASKRTRLEFVILAPQEPPRSRPGMQCRRQQSNRLRHRYGCPGSYRQLGARWERRTEAVDAAGASREALGAAVAGAQAAQVAVTMAAGAAGNVNQKCDRTAEIAA